MKAIRLGDGAYASVNRNGDLLITVLNHLPREATDVVCIEARATQHLVKFINDNFTKETVPEDSMALAVSLLKGIADRNTAAYAATLQPAIHVLAAAGAQKPGENYE